MQLYIVDITFQTMNFQEVKTWSFLTNSLNMTLEDFISGTIQNKIFKSLYVKNFRSSFKSHPLWILLYILKAINVKQWFKKVK